MMLGRRPNNVLNLAWAELELVILKVGSAWLGLIMRLINYSFTLFISTIISRHSTNKLTKMFVIIFFIA